MVAVSANLDRKNERERLVRGIARSAGVADQRILEAFRSVPRECFVPENQVGHAYEDRALPIGRAQTISQPSMIALMFQALEPAATDRALEVGAGSGYAAALLGTLVREVYALELLPELAEHGRENLARAGVKNVSLLTAHGEFGLPAYAPYDVILVSAGARSTPSSLLEQLAPGGRIAIPVGDESGQRLLLGRKTPAGAVEWEQKTPCVFVPLVTASA
jgi:protein-L-isoaspartate(D-aspartate) O-methyltransferase